MLVSPIRVLAFDVFGTVVDVRDSLRRETAAFGARIGIVRDWHDFADRWRQAYPAAVADINAGTAPWRSVDAINNQSLDDLLRAAGLMNVPAHDRTFLRGAWRRLARWSDAIEALNRLKSRFKIVALTNGNQ